MIRIRIDTDVIETELLGGIVYYKRGVPYGRVVIEQSVTKIKKSTGETFYDWEPVEVVG